MQAFNHMPPLSLSHTKFLFSRVLSEFPYILFFSLINHLFLSHLSSLSLFSCDRLLKSSNHHHRATYTYSFRFIYFRQILSRFQQQTFYVSLSKKRIEPNQDERESIFCDCFSFDSIKYHSTHSV